MTPIEALTHGDGTITITITEPVQLEWLRSAGLADQFLTLATHRLPLEERKKLYPTLAEVIQPVLVRYSSTERSMTE